MRAVLTNSVRPRIGHLRSGPPHAVSAPIRRTAIPPSRRKLTVCDAFTILLTPVLTAAFVVDVTHKDRIRERWDQMLAQVQQETAILIEKELRVWETLQLRSIQAGVIHQRRNFGTLTRQVVPSSKNYDAQSETGIQPDSDKHATSDRARRSPVQELKVLHKYENYLAVRIGLQLLLYTCTGTIRLPRLEMDDFQLGMVKPDSIDALLQQLSFVNDTLHRLQFKLPEITAVVNENDPDRVSLDQHISELTWRCRTGGISLYELICSYTQAVMRSCTGPSINTYQNLVDTFSTLKAQNLTAIAMQAYLKTQQVLKDKHITTIILQYGRIKDPGGLASFLNHLTREDRHFEIETGWEILTVDGLRVPVPVNRHHRTLDALIRAALQGDQPHKAGAWATVLLKEEASNKRLAFLFNHFLSYCARHKNWIHGEQWLYRTITWATWIGKETPDVLQKLIFRMLDLCFSCNRSEEYNKLMNAAADAGIDVPKVDHTRPSVFTEQSIKIREDWARIIKQKNSRVRSQDDFIEAATIFQTEMAALNSAIEGFIGVAGIAQLRTFFLRSIQPATKQNADEETMANMQSYNFQPWAGLSDIPVPEDLPPSVSGFETTSAMLTQGEEGDLKITDQHTSSIATADAALQAQPELRKITEVMRAQNTSLLEKLEASEDREQELLHVIEQLKSQLNAVKPKNLETVFVEKENKRLRVELNALSGQYLTALNEKEDALNKLATMQSRYDDIEKRMAAHSQRLRRENEALQEQLQSTDATC